MAGKSVDVGNLVMKGAPIGYNYSSVNTDGQVYRFSNSNNNGNKFNINSRNPFVFKRKPEGHMSIFVKRAL